MWSVSDVVASRESKNVDFCCRRSLEESPVGQYCRERLRLNPKFSYLGEILGAGGGADEAAKNRV